MEHKSNIHFKSQRKHNQNHNLEMRHLFVTTWLISHDSHTNTAVTSPPKSKQSKPTQERTGTNQCKRKRTETHKSNGQQNECEPRCHKHIVYIKNMKVFWANHTNKKVLQRTITQLDQKSQKQKITSRIEDTQTITTHQTNNGKRKMKPANEPT